MRNTTYADKSNYLGALQAQKERGARNVSRVHHDFGGDGTDALALAPAFPRLTVTTKSKMWPMCALLRASGLPGQPESFEAQLRVYIVLHTSVAAHQPGPQESAYYVLLIVTDLSPAETWKKLFSQNTGYC